MIRTVKTAFLDHPASVDETYGEHFLFASRFGGRLILAGLAAMIHGILPFAFETTASRTIREMYERTANRGRS